MAKLTHMADELRRIAGELEAWRDAAEALQKQVDGLKEGWPASCATHRWVSFTKGDTCPGCEPQHPQEATCPHGVPEAKADWCQECKPSPPRAVEVDTIPAPPVKTTYLQVAKAFKARYEKARQMEWHIPRNTQDCYDLADWIDGQAERDKRDPKAVGKQLLDGFFADRRIREAGYPIAWLAKDPGGFYRPASEDGAPNEAERMKRRYEAHKRYEIAKARAGASRHDCDMSIPEVAAIFDQ